MMAKLTKAQAKAHAEAVKILQQDALTDDEREFVFLNWREDAEHINSSAGAFFTPLELAQNFAVEIGSQGGRIIDLCAGIGMLSCAIWWHHSWSSKKPDLTCVELNPEYAAVGRKLVPWANWIQADVLDVPSMGLGHFDFAISNPPFGKIKRPDGKSAPNYSGGDFEYHVISVASQIAELGVFILPQMSAGFEYSGKPEYRRQADDSKAGRFQKQSGLHFEAGCGIDTAIFKDQWRGVSPICEIVVVEFEGEAKAIEQAPQAQRAVVTPPPVFEANDKGQLTMFELDAA